MGGRTREPRVNVCGSRARGGAVLVDGVEAVLAEETGLAVLMDAVDRRAGRGRAASGSGEVCVRYELCGDVVVVPDPSSVGGV